ncbi:MAG TPA: hypothetical protein VD860_15820, partial [Azospirillum sp.]|nr:hypothetical protein [Azospirillum sp.]
MAAPRPILTLDFAATGRVDRRLAFARASRGVRLTPQGRLRTSPAGQPRVESAAAGGPRGLLLEGAATNLLPYGAGLGWTDCLPTTESVRTGLPAPDGSPTACRVSSPSAVSVHRLRLDGPPAPGPYTGSLYVRPAGGGTLSVELFCYDQGAYPLDGRALIDLAGGVLLPGSSPGATLRPAGDGWSRVAIPTAEPIDGTAVFLLIVAPDPDGMPGAPCAVDVWGAQLEPGTAASSFIATAAGSAARAADACSLPLALVRGWTPAEGTLLVEGALRGTAGPPRTLAALTGSGDGLTLRVLGGGEVR